MTYIRPTLEQHTDDRERQLELLIHRLPQSVQGTVHWLRRPSSRRIRIPASILLIFGSFLFILPVFGLWMLPLGLILLAEDIAPLRRLTDPGLSWIERKRPNWMGLPSEHDPLPGRAGRDESRRMRRFLPEGS